MTRQGVVIAVLVALMIPLSVGAQEVEADLNNTAAAFMEAYVHGDWQAVESYLTHGQLNVYGSDVGEFANDRAGFKAMFDNDHKLWKGAARFGAMSDVSSVHSGSLATLFFNRIFEIGDQKVIVRFSTVWRREAKKWKLVQSSNTVPTEGQSAATILARPPH